MLRSLLGSAAAITVGIGGLAAELVNPVNAQGTWIAVHRDQRQAPPGTIAAQMGMNGVVTFIDVKSIVRRGSMAYFNLSVAVLDKYGMPRAGHVHKGTGWSANCKTKMTKGQAGPWTSFSDAHGPGEAARFACD